MVGIAVFLLSLLFSNSCFAYSASLSTSGDIELDITPTSSGATAIAEDELIITSTCPSGYTLYLSGTSDNSLYLEGDNTTTAAPISASSASLANPDLLSPNTWGFSLSPSASSFAGLTDSLVAIKSPTGQASTDESFSVYYAANANLDRVGGTYTTSGNSTTLTYTLIPELACFQFTLRFNGGTDDASLEGSMANQEILSGETNVISPNQFKRVGYVFAGWSTAEGETLDNLSSDELYFCGSYCDEDPDDAEGYAEMIPNTISNYISGSNAIIDLYVVWRPIKVVYDGNAGSNSDSTNAVEGSMGTLEHSVAINEEITLYAPNYSRTGYGNAGWSTNPEAGTNLSCTDDPETVEDECDGFSPATVLGPNATVAVTAANFPGEDFKEDITLYAVWIPADTTYTMQTFDSAACSALTAATYDSSTGVVTPGSVLALRDERDDDVYTVAKLADGRCWMAENLRIDPPSADITVDNTDLDRLDDPVLAFLPSMRNDTRHTISGYGSKEYSYKNFNVRSRAANPTSRNTYTYSYGYYYSWYLAAMTNTKDYNQNNNRRSETSICARGWRLPSGGNGSDRDFWKLKNALSSSLAAIRAFPNNIIYSGRYEMSPYQYYGRGSVGQYWSDRAMNSSAIIIAFISASEMNPNNFIPAYEQTPVRCILNNPETYTLTFNANGGSSKPANQTLSSDRGRGAITITDEIPTHSDSNLVFVGWSTDSNATEATYQPGDVFTAWKAGTTYTLYAIWQPFITVHFDGNGNTSGTMADQAIPQGTSKALRTNTFAKTGYKFVGWGSSADATALAYADKASYTAPASVTQGDTDTLYALWRVPYTIVYDGNNADAGTMFQTHSNVANLNRITLYASNFSREGYGFIGWSFDPDAGSKVNTASQPTIYGPNETITVPDLSDTNYDSSTGNATLYAVWVPADTTYTMQTFDSSDFSSESTGYILALRDERDDDVYAVAKLADGNFWMIENLRLDPSSSDTSIASSNTNNPTSTFIDTDIANILDGTDTESFKTCTAESSTCYDQISFGLGNLNGDTEASSNSSQTAKWYSYGVMYNWYTATAGNGTYSIASGAASGDICPSSWHIPYGGDDTGVNGGNTSGGFYYLGDRLGAISDNATSSNLWRSFPNNMILSGYYNSTTATNRGAHGYYWTTHGAANALANRFYIYSDNVSVAISTSRRRLGHAVRCIAD